MSSEKVNVIVVVSPAFRLAAPLLISTVGSLVSTAISRVSPNSVLVVGEVRELVGSDRDLHSRIFDIRARGVECRVDGLADLVQRTREPLSRAMSAKVNEASLMSSEKVNVIVVVSQLSGNAAPLLISTVGRVVSTAICKLSPVAFSLPARSANLLAAIEICTAGSSTSCPGCRAPCRRFR